MMKSNRFWALVLGGVLLAAGAACLWLMYRPAAGTVAKVYQNGVCIRTIDLSAVTEGYTFTVTGERGAQNVVAVEPGRIRVESASCPDQVCVHQGWVSDGAAPLVCLPNGLVIQLEGGGEDAPDTVVG